MGREQSVGHDSTSWADAIHHAGLRPCAAVSLHLMHSLVSLTQEQARHRVRCPLQHRQQECDCSMSATSRLLVCLMQNTASCMPVDTVYFMLEDDYLTIVAPNPAVLEAV